MHFSASFGKSKRMTNKAKEAKQSCRKKQALDLAKQETIKSWQERPTYCDGNFDWNWFFSFHLKLKTFLTNNFPFQIAFNTWVLGEIRERN